ncbi:MAG: VanZ family protein [Bacteroidales bacterium]|nr:VanZ family protein [Bacteroidales bacterium]
MIRHIKRYPLTILVALAICYLSFFKPPQTELNKIANIDKLVHICMYGGLCTILWFEHLLSHSSLCIGKVMLMAIILPILMSGVIEYLQSTLTEYRGFEWADLLANSIGVVAAALLGFFVLRPLVWKYKRQ